MEHKIIKKRIIVFSIIVVCGFACSYYFLKKGKASGTTIENSAGEKENSNKVLLLNEKVDFENDKDASSEKAFSGKNSNKLTSQNEYGFSINKKIKDIPNYQQLNQIDLEVKCWEKQKTGAVYVLSIEDSLGKNQFWEGKPIVCDKDGNWCTLHFVFDLKPEAIKPNYSIKLYPWNKAKEEFFIDDISVSYNATEKNASSNSSQSFSSNFFFDFENAEGLTGTESIKETTAHSGKMACDLSKGKEYGPVVIKTVNQLSLTTINKISASVWVYPLTDKPNAVLTVSITNSKGENIYWDGRTTENRPFPVKQWTKLNGLYNLPLDKISPTDKIQVNVWNKGRTDLIVDDMEIVYGESPERLGAPSPVDANTIYEKQFVPQKNKPPFKTIYFVKQEINTGNATFITKDKSNPSANFSPNDNYIVGDFIKDKNNLDELISIKSGKATMFQYSPESKEFKEVIGKIINPDSLLKAQKGNETLKSNSYFKPSDVVFSGDYFGDKKSELLKLNTDWRFDLQLIEQNKDEFTILGNVDFKGYSNDYNPKYYEFTKIISGRFINANKTSLLIISCNCGDSNFNGTQCNQLENIATLPNSLGVYTIEIK